MQAKQERPSTALLTCHSACLVRPARAPAFASRSTSERGAAAARPQGRAILAVLLYAQRRVEGWGVPYPTLEARTAGRTPP